MNVKTLTGSSIQAALTEARDQLGDHVVLVESTPATEDAPASITVMADRPIPASTAPASRSRVPALATQGEGAPGAVPAPSDWEGEQQGPAKTLGSSGFGYAARTNRSAASEGANFSQALARQQGTGRGRFFPSTADRAKEESTAGRQSTEREERLEAQLKRLGDRLNDMERRFGGAVIGSGQRWAAHPLFGEMLECGMRPGTLTKLFGELAERGHDPENANPENLRWALAQVLRKRLHVPTPKGSSGALAFIGPGGAGKTSLLLKLATHGSFFARREPAVIVLQPEEEEGTAYQNPTDLYRRFSLPVQNVRTEEEMAQALKRVEHFGQVLVDTPPLPLPLAEARPTLRRFERLLRPLMPLDVHVALSATRAFGGFDAETLQRLPLKLSAVALTHLDEVPGWGRVAEWLMTIDQPVQFVSDSPGVPDGARAFSPTWFVEEMMGL